MDEAVSSVDSSVAVNHVGCNAQTADMLLRNFEYENTAVEICPNIVPIELHQAAVSKVICFLDCSRHLQGEVKYRRGTSSQCQPGEFRLGQAGKARIDVQQKRTDCRINVAGANPDVGEQPDGLRRVGVVETKIVIDRPTASCCPILAR